jgi:hypothetical protein
MRNGRVSIFGKEWRKPQNQKIKQTTTLNNPNVLQSSINVVSYLI